MTQAPRPNPYDMETALASLADEHRRQQEIQEKIRNTTTTLHSKDRVLSVTVDGRGELTKLAFDGTRYKRLPPAELAKVLTDTITSARKDALGKLGEMMGGDVLPGVSFQEMATGTVEIGKVIDSFLGAAIDGLPDRIASQLRGRVEGVL